jgi:hypothetical protein
METYSSADVSCGGSCLASRRDAPASRGDEMLFLLMGMMAVVKELTLTARSNSMIWIFLTKRL